MTLCRWTLALVSAALLSSCATTSRYDAAGDVHQLLVAIRNHDQAGFEAHVDRAALKTQLRGRLMAEAAKAHGSDSLAVLGALLARPLVDVAVDQLVQPDVFGAVADYMGYSAAKPLPDRVAIASVLRPIDETTVCAPRKKDGPCVLVFRKETGSWRLVGFEGDIGMLKAGPTRR
ncbi:MAG: hypothetical protein RLZZ141_1549 [Pseudomonadota bacterium]